MLRLTDYKIEDFDWKNRIIISQSETSDLCKVVNIKTVAIRQYKITQFSNSIHLSFEGKLSALTLVNSQFILKYFKTFTFPQFVYTVFQFCGTNLQQFYLSQKKSLTVEEIRKVAYCIAKGMLAIETAKCVHGSLNPINVLKKGNIWKLTNFTKFQKISKKQYQKQYIKEGVYKYLSPEALSSGINSQRQSIMSDVWSFGIILYQLTYKHIPFNRAEELNYTNYVKEINNSKIPYGKSNRIDQSLVNLIQSCLKKSPEQRLTWSMIIQHPFLASLQSCKSIIEKSQQQRNIQEIISMLQESALKKMGQLTSLKRFCSGDISWKGIHISSDTKLRYDQFSQICQFFNPQIKQNQFKMLVNQIDITNKGYIDQKMLTQLLTSQIRAIIFNFFTQLSSVIKKKNISASQMFQKFDRDQSGTLQSKQILEISKFLLPNFSNSHLSMIMDYINKQFNGKVPIKTFYDQCNFSNLNSQQSKESKVAEQLQSLKNQFKLININIAQIVRTFDKDKNDNLDFYEFKKLVYSIDKFVRQKQLKLMFDEVDKDKSGHISVQQLQSFFNHK